MFYVDEDGTKITVFSWRSEAVARIAAAAVGLCRVGLFVPPDGPHDVEHWCVIKDNGEPMTALEYRWQRDLVRARK